MDRLRANAGFDESPHEEGYSSRGLERVSGIGWLSSRAATWLTIPNNERPWLAGRRRGEWLEQDSPATDSGPRSWAVMAAIHNGSSRAPLHPSVCSARPKLPSRLAAKPIKESLRCNGFLLSGFSRRHSL